MESGEPPHEPPRSSWIGYKAAYEALTPEKEIQAIELAMAGSEKSMREAEIRTAIARNTRQNLVYKINQWRERLIEMKAASVTDAIGFKVLRAQMQKHLEDLRIAEKQIEDLQATIHYEQKAIRQFLKRIEALSVPKCESKVLEFRSRQ